jgi:hypothetical protein
VEGEDERKFKIKPYGGLPEFSNGLRITDVRLFLNILFTDDDVSVAKLSYQFQEPKRDGETEEEFIERMKKFNLNRSVIITTKDEGLIDYLTENNGLEISNRGQLEPEPPLHSGEISGTDENTGQLLGMGKLNRQVLDRWDLDKN